MIGAIPVQRGCGKRKKGGIYAECGLSEFGKPAEEFLVDPIQKIDPDEFGLTPVNQRLIKGPDEIWHVLDWVGSNNYPNPIDWFEEVRRFGMSDRLELQHNEYALLTPMRSQVFAVHARAWINYAENDTRVGMSDEPYLYTWDYCPKGLYDHDSRNHPAPGEFDCCAGAMWSDLLRKGEDTEGHGREVKRNMPSFSYWAALANTFYQHKPGIFAKFPITRIVVVKDPDDSNHQDKQLKKLDGISIPFELVEE